MPNAMPAVRGFLHLRDRLLAVARKTLLYLSFNDSSVLIFLLSAKEMRKLEEKAGIQRHNHAPNVLSFAEPVGFPHPETKDNILGEVYINKDLAANGFKELAYLLIHGILHIVGYSHDRKNDILKMEALEKRICRKVLQGED